ncbi:MAG: protoheme IX farnesyltransferase [Candidatus Zixiibacteriota bacterium]|nr:MAG: protoheme IX farnesyltransferase [candidate division Zixibacteria bacterium]
MNSPVKSLSSYMELTKPTIMLLVLFTGAVSLIVEGSLLARPGRFALVLLGLYLTGGSANALNQYFERDLDARMKRTSGRRPLPTGRIGPAKALAFSAAMGVIGVGVFAVFFNWLTALLSVLTILFYSLFYTLFLKPRTAQNIVIGGIAGAMAPVGAWTAATGSFDIIPWILFAIVFFWTPPHFWALALFCRDDYVRTGQPMLPVTSGNAATLRQILNYTLVLFAVSLSIMIFGGGWFYLVVALALGGLFVKRVLDAMRLPQENVLRRLFGYSITYLFGIFAALAFDRLFS